MGLHATTSHGTRIGGVRLRRGQAAIVKGLEDAFRNAGLPDPALAARFATYTLLTGNNPRRASKYQTQFQVPPSTFSGWLSNMDWQAFIDAMNRWCRQNVKSLLAKHRPHPGSLVNIADVHQDEYEPDWLGRWRKTSRRVRPELSRRLVAVKATAQNKKSGYANPWLVCGLTWTSAGRDWTVPYHFELLTSGKHGPDHHARQMCRILRAMGISPDANVLDNYYQSGRVRDVFRRFSWTYRIRHKARGSNAQLATELATGRHCRTTDLLAETILHPDAQQQTRFDRQRGKFVMEFVRSVRVQLGSDDDETQLVLIARAKRHDKKATWIVDDFGSMIVACTPGDDYRSVMRDYRKRWQIETCFRDLVNAKPSHASKTIPSHVLAFLGHAVHILHAKVKLNEDQIEATDGTIRGSPASQWTLVESASEILGEDPLKAPIVVE